MLTRESLLTLLTPVTDELGLKVFDIDLPSSKSSVLRIYITRASLADADEDKENQQAGVGLDDCERLSRKLSELDEFERLLPENSSLEISSPGVNRKLRLAEHFQEAVGEHLWVKYFNSESQKNVVVRGLLKKFENDELLLLSDGAEEETVVHLDDLVSARVDFLFQ